jgi:hypothetical protein
MKGDIGISDTGMALAIALGTIAPIVVIRSIEVAEITGAAPFLAISVVVFGVVGTLSTYLIRAPSSVVAVLICGGIAIGVGADSTIDQLAFSRERYPLALEIVAMWTIALVPGAAGFILGERMRENSGPWQRHR